MQVSTSSSETTNNNNSRIKDFPRERRVYIIAVPKCHDNLFRHLQNNHDWLSASTVNFGFTGIKSTITHWTKKINTKEEFDKLERFIRDLREEKSELFIDQSYYPKPKGVSIKSYITEFIKSKGVANHYTFSTYYRVTVFPFGADIDNYPPQIGTHKTTGEPVYAPDERNEYLIVPLLIRLKHGKTYDQSKIITYTNQKPDGTWEYEVSNVNHHCFKRDPESILLDNESSRSRRSLGWIDDEEEEEGEEDN